MSWADGDRPRRRRGRGLATLLVTVVLLGGLAVAADRAAVWLAEGAVQRALTRVADDVETGPDVTIDGFPFLPQLMTGVDRVTVQAGGVVLDGTRFADVEATFTDVDLGEPRRAGGLDARAELGTDDLLEPFVSALGDRADAVDVQTDADGLSLSTAVAGVDLGLRLTPAVRDDGLVVDVSAVTLGGVSVELAALPDQLVEPVQGLALTLDDLPDGVRITSVTTTESGFVLTARGQDVLLDPP